MIRYLWLLQNLRWEKERLVYFQIQIGRTEVVLEKYVFFSYSYSYLKKYLWLDLIQWSKTLTPLLKLKTERILPLIICCYMHSSVVRCRGHVRCSMPELKMQKCIRKPKRACSAQPQATSTCSSKIDQLRKSGRQSLGEGLLLLLLVQRVVYTLALPIFRAEKKRTCWTVKW